MAPLEAQYDGASGAPMMPYVEAMLTMELRGRRRRCGIAALAHRKVPRRLTAIVRSQASMSSSWRRCDPPEMPASLTSTSSCPKSATAPATRAATCSASATSQDRKDALPPALRISSAVRRPPSTFVSPMATVAPAAAMSRAMARPIPVAPPVRSTTRSLSDGISPSLLVLFANSPCSTGPQKLVRETVQDPAALYHAWPGTSSASCSMRARVKMDGYRREGILGCGTVADPIRLESLDEDSYYRDPSGFFARLRES